jgi:hypothetical protein
VENKYLIFAAVEEGISAAEIAKDLSMITLISSEWMKFESRYRNEFPNATIKDIHGGFIKFWPFVVQHDFKYSKHGEHKPRSKRTRNAKFDASSDEVSANISNSSHAQRFLAVFS